MNEKDKRIAELEQLLQENRERKKCQRGKCPSLTLIYNHLLITAQTHTSL